MCPFNHTKLKLLLYFHFVIIFTAKLQAQSCFNINARSDTTISCLLPCFNLEARIPDIRSSEDYFVIPISYDPYPYTTTAPAWIHPCMADQDDKFAPIANLPFNFCFYGNVFTQYVLGTNGVITFDTSNAMKGNNYLVTDPLPFLGSGFRTYVCPGSPPGALYPKLSILGNYQDLKPDFGDPIYKIEARVEGTAPCRRFIMSYSKVKFFNCPTLRATFEVVLHESTGLIDVFIENQPSCGNAIIGIQKDGLPGTPFTSPPGRNLYTQALNNEAWRFVPSGPTSLFVNVVLYKNGVPVSTGLTTPLGNGELGVTFPNVCQSEDSMSYTVKAFYKKCDNPASLIEGADTMIVYKSLNPISINISDAKCFGSSSGNITVTSPVGANIEYSINGGLNWQASPSFLVPAGIYSVTARLIGSTCNGSSTVTINEPTKLTATSVVTNSDCNNNKGVINVTALGGTPGYEYSIDGGVTYLPTNIFTGLSVGPHTVNVRDTRGCITTITSVILLVNDTMRLELGPDSTICFGNSLRLSPQTNDSTNIFKWTPVSGLNYDTIKNPIASPNDTTKYILVARWGACQRTDSITINVKHRPIPYAGKDTIICNNDSALLHGSVSNLSGTVNFAWNPSIYISSPNSAITIVKPDSSQVFVLTVTDNYGCNFSISDSVLVTMEMTVPVFAGNDTTAMFGKPHQLFATGGVSYVWSPSLNLNNPFIQDPLATLFNDTYFRVNVTDAAGCKGFDDVFIKVYQGPTYYIPNAFSPNGDGLNDIFRPIPVGIGETDFFIVYDRYGEVVFKTNKWLDGWDGKFKNKNASQGTYIWIIKGKGRNGEVVEMRGSVILLR